MGKGKYVTKEQCYIDYVKNNDFEKIQEEQALESGEIFIPEAEEEEQHNGFYEEFVIVPAGKYEMLVRESERLTAVTRYVCSDKLCMGAIKALLEVER